MMPPYMSVKVRETTTPGTMCPNLFEKFVDSLTPHKFITCARACDTRPTVYRPYPRRLRSQTRVCRCYYKGSTFSVLVRPGFKPTASRSADWRLSHHGANRAAVLMPRRNPCVP